MKNLKSVCNGKCVSTVIYRQECKIRASKSTNNLCIEEDPLNEHRIQRG